MVSHGRLHSEHGVERLRVGMLLLTVRAVLLCCRLTDGRTLMTIAFLLFLLPQAFLVYMRMGGSLPSGLTGSLKFIEVVQA